MNKNTSTNRAYALKEHNANVWANAGLANHTAVVDLEPFGSIPTIADTVVVYPYKFDDWQTSVIIQMWGVSLAKSDSDGVIEFLEGAKDGYMSAEGASEYAYAVAKAYQLECVQIAGYDS